MRKGVAWAGAIALALGFLGSCSLGKGEGGSKREELLSQLKQEAQGLKRDGEKVNPALGVASTWNIESVDVREQPGNDSQPWAGTIRFRIESRMKEVDGSLVGQQFEKRFDYVYSSVLNRWIIQYVPPSPPPRKP